MFNSLNTGSISEVDFCNNFPLHHACRDGDVQAGGLLLESNPNTIFVEDSCNGWNPSHWAASFGKFDSLRQVSSAFPNIVNSQSSKSYQTPLHCAAEAGHARCVLWLLQAGSNPNVKDNLGETALHKAARGGHLECISLLITSSSNVSVVNNVGQTASNIAEVSGHFIIAEHIRSREELIGMNRTWGFTNSHHIPFHNSDFPMTGLRKKRSHDAMIESNAKRTRIEDSNFQNAPAAVDEMFDFTLNAPTVTSSVVEHEKLCRMERGYTNSLLESIIAEFHGC